MKRTVAILMILCIFLSVCGCKKDETSLMPPNDGRPTEPPPSVSVTIGGVTPPCHGDAGWTRYQLNNGMTCIVESSRVHPLDREYKLFKTSVGRAELQFSELPTYFGANAWPKVPEGGTIGDVEPIQLTMEGHSFSLLEGDYIYEVHASWEYKDKDASSHRSFNAVYTP